MSIQSHTYDCAMAYYFLDRFVNADTGSSTVMDSAIGTTFNFQIPIEKMIPLIVHAGFDRVSLAGGNARESGYLDADCREKTRRVCRQHDVRVDSIHAPFGAELDISSPDSAVRAIGIDLVLRAIDACALFDSTQLMFHLNDRFNDDELGKRIKLIEKSMALIVAYAEQKQIDLTVENLPSLQAGRLFDHVLSLYPAHRVGVCLDTSHAHLSHALYDIMGTCGTRITAVHISDNRGEHDDHVLPFEGTIDWNRFARHFARTGYAGTFLLEVEMRESAFQDPEIFLMEAYRRSEKILKMIAQYQNAL